MQEWLLCSVFCLFLNMSPVHHQEPFLVDAFPTLLRVHKGNVNCYFSLIPEAGQPEGGGQSGAGPVGLLDMQSFLQQTFKCSQVPCIGWDGKLLAVQGTWDRALRGESGRAALMGTAKGLR